MAHDVPPARAGSGDRAPTGSERRRDDMLVEYYKLVDLVSAFDQRLLTIKGWGVTVGLASLGAGFQQRHYGIFLVAALSGLAFWIVEALTKRHQMRHYPRMREIEVASFRYDGVDLDGERLSAPRIDWSWTTAPIAFGERDPGAVDLGVPQPYACQAPASTIGRAWRSVRPMFFVHLAMPHLVSFVAGAILFALGAAGRLDEMPI